MPGCIGGDEFLNVRACPCLLAMDASWMERLKFMLLSSTMGPARSGNRPAYQNPSQVPYEMP